MMNKNFQIKDTFLLVLLSLSLGVPVKAADLDYTDDRLRKLWLSFSDSDSKLRALSSQATCSASELEKANGFATDIKRVNGEISVVVKGLTSMVNSKKADIEKLEKELSLSANKFPSNFISVSAELAVQPKILVKEEQNALIQLVNKNTIVSFVDSSGKKRIANKEKISELDRESREILLNVALSWLADGSALKNFRYDQSSVDDVKSKSSSFAFLTAKASDGFSTSARGLILNSNITVEAITQSLGSEVNGANALNAELEKMRVPMKKYGLSELKAILANVSDRNLKEANAKKVSPEVDETKKQRIAELKRDLQPLENALYKKWKETQGRVESVALALNTRLSRCEAANKKVREAAGKPVDQVPEAQKVDPFLKSIGIETHTTPAPKK